MLRLHVCPVLVIAIVMVIVNAMIAAIAMIVLTGDANGELVQ